MKTEEQIREQYRLIRGSLDERGRCEWASSEAMSLGYGGIALVHRAEQGAGALLICLLSWTYHSRCGVSRQRRAQYANKQSSGTVLRFGNRVPK